jgi:hypothetical protein
VSLETERAVELDAKHQGLKKAQWVRKAVEAYLLPRAGPPKEIVKTVVPMELDSELMDLQRTLIALREKVDYDLRLVSGKAAKIRSGLSKE